jgi:hypothetical protein
VVNERQGLSAAVLESLSAHATGNDGDEQTRTFSMRFLIGTLVLAFGVVGCASVKTLQANSTTFDNYSTRGNSNPYTRERGYRSNNDNGFKPLSSWGSDGNWDE